MTDPISEFTNTEVVTRDGTGRRTARSTDVIGVATGFRASDPPIARRIFGHRAVRA